MSEDLTKNKPDALFVYSTKYCAGSKQDRDPLETLSGAQIGSLDQGLDNFARFKLILTSSP